MLIHGRPGGQLTSPAALASAVVCSLWAAWAGSAAAAPPLSSHLLIPNPEYFRRPHPAQERIVPSRIRILAHPTTGAPALVTAGGEISLLVGAPLPSTGGKAKVTVAATISGRKIRARLPLLGARPVAEGRMSRLRCRVPAWLPRGSYDVSLSLGRGRTERHPSALRVRHGSDGPPLVALVADHQLWDPSVLLGSGRKSPNSFPRLDSDSESVAIARQELAELRLLDPDVILHLGDLVFGLSYAKELRQAMRLWQWSGLAAHMVPGNHDGYALYGLNLEASLPKLSAGVLRCRRHFPGTLRSWARIWTFLVCVYGNLKATLFDRLLDDGLVHWRRNLGPTHYAFTLGRYRFIGLNTYDGTPQRRHAFAIWVSIKGLHLGVPMVDNYGGYLSLSQLRWLRGELQKSAAAGLTPVVFGHHDPRGNPTGTPYHANQPFPTDPVGPNHFEAWNFDAAWDSNPADGRSRESKGAHSGHALLRLLARHGGYYLSGHVHRDSQRVYLRGQELAPGIRARRRVTFIKVTTSSSSPGEGGYWGYRLLRLRPDGQLLAPPFARGLLSVPTGNLWAERHEAPSGGRVLTVHTGLPRPVAVHFQLPLLRRPRGWRFSSPDAGVKVTLLGVTPLPPRSGGGAEALYRVRVKVPAAGAAVARLPSDIALAYVYARPATANAPPRARLLVDGSPVDAGTTIRVRPGAELRLDSSGSSDPDGDRLLPAAWALADGRGGHGARLKLPLTRRGRHTLSLTVRDEHGAADTIRVQLLVGKPDHPAPPPRPGCAGCSTRGAGEKGAPLGLLLFLALLASLRSMLSALVKLSRRGGGILP